MNSIDVHLHASSRGRTSVLKLSILLVLMTLPIGASSNNKTCNPMVDIVIAVDTSSSCTDAEFQRLLSKVNDIASMFEIDPFKNQLALIGMSDSPQLVANFGDVRSQADFSSAVGKLKRTTNKSVDMTLGLKLARESAFTSDRGRSVSKLLTLVKRCYAVCTDPIDGKHYHDGESWTSFCHELRCDRGRTVQSDRRTKCLAADLSCKPIGSPPFQCRNSEGSLLDNCRCVSDNEGRAALVMEYVTSRNQTGTQ